MTARRDCSSASTPIRGGLERYIENHIPPGHFLTAVLQNDLRAACARGDDNALRCLVALVRWLYQEAPQACWGSPRHVAEWLFRKGREI